MSESIIYEDGELRDSVAVLFLITHVVGLLVTLAGIYWALKQAVLVAPTVAIKAHRLAYTFTEPLYVGFVYGIVLSYLIFRVRQYWGDRV